jgi:hypothetical protein
VIAGEAFVAPLPAQSRKGPLDSNLIAAVHLCL